METMRALLVVTLICLACPPLEGAIPLPGVMSEDLVLLIYDPADGGLRLEAGDKQLTALEIVSAGKNFVGSSPFPQGGLFDVFTPSKLFMLRVPPSQFSEYDFGTPLAPGLTAAEISADLSVSGAVYPFGGLGPVGVGSEVQVGLVYVPEPSTLTLLGWGLLGWASLRRSGRRGSTRRA